MSEQKVVVVCMCCLLPLLYTCTFHTHGRGHAVLTSSAVCACRLYAYEGVGVLLGQEELPAEEQHAYIAALLQPLIHQVCPCVTH